MQFFLNLWQRIRNFNFRELSRTQIVVGLAGGIIALWIIAQLLSFIVAILNIAAPIAILTLIGYFGYNYMQSRSEDIPDELRKSKQEREVDEAVANYRAALEGKDLNTDVETDTVVEVQTVEEIEADTAAKAEVVEEEKEENLVIKQVINPETGFKEPDISRLIEHEEQKLKEADKVNDDIMAQIEARRKRLQNSDK